MSTARRTDLIIGIASHQLFEDALRQLWFIRFNSFEIVSEASADSVFMAQSELLIKLAYRNGENGVELISLNNRSGLLVIL
jgi:hypothetical protein